MNAAKEAKNFPEPFFILERFNTAFKSLSDWIHDKEDLTANQEPPSHDYQVVKTLSDNQKLLLKMAKDQQGALDSLNDLAMKVIDQQPEEEGKATREDMSEQNRRFQMLLASINTRQEKLDQVGRRAKEFRDVKDGLLGWIDGAEQKAAKIEASATDPAKVQSQIDELKVSENTRLLRENLHHSSESF